MPRARHYRHLKALPSNLSNQQHQSTNRAADLHRLAQHFRPALVEDGKVDGEGDGSDEYHSEKESGERWDPPSLASFLGGRVCGM